MPAIYIDRITKTSVNKCKVQQLCTMQLVVLVGRRGQEFHALTKAGRELDLIDALELECGRRLKVGRIKPMSIASYASHLNRNRSRRVHGYWYTAMEQR